MIYTKKKLLELIDTHIETVKNVKECHKQVCQKYDIHEDKAEMEYLNGQLAALDRLRREIEPFKQIKS